MDNNTNYAEVNDAKIYYELTGNGETIILIHGNFGDSSVWDNQVEVLAEHFEVLRYDLRGFGRSSMPEIAKPYAHFDDLKELMEYLNISKAHICGHSMGCGMAINFVLQYPDLCLSLIAVGPWIFGYDPPSIKNLNDIFEKIATVLKENGTKQAIDIINDLLIVNSAWPLIPRGWVNPNANSSAYMRIKKIGSDYSFWHWKYKDPVISLSPPAFDRLDQIIIPSLIITSEYDIIACQEVAEILNQNIPDVKLYTIKEASHAMFIDKIEEFNKILLNFLKFR